MSNNRTFFKKAVEGEMSLRDIFSDVFQRHTPEQTSRVFIAGTELTTPSEADMLAGWQKPFLFARFLIICAATILLAYVLSFLSPSGYDVVLVGMAVLIPFSVLLLAWEMNIPRTISLMEILKIVAVGGVLSLIITLVLGIVQDLLGIGDGSAAWAPVIEEPAKLAIVYYLLKKKNRKYILEGILLGMAVGTGFAVMETLNYIMNYMRAGMVEAFIYMLAELYEAGYSSSDILATLFSIATDGSALKSLGMELLYEGGFATGMHVAVVRAINGIAGHGMYAAMYGGGLMIAKGREAIRPGHLLDGTFLKYFLVSCLVHFLNNWSFFTGLFYSLLGENYILGTAPTLLAISLLFFLPLLKTGVNQIVEVCTAYNQGRVTVAVNREVKAPSVGTESFDPHYDTGARIEWLAGPLMGQTTPLAPGQTLTIGRGSNCSVPLMGSSNVSSMHCSIALQNGMVVVRDLGSTNGTYVSGQRLGPNQPIPVADGGVVYLGNRNCGFRIVLR